jgi:hypothetical protein
VGLVTAVAFVIEHAYVDALACFREPIKYFAARGFEVDVYLRMTPFHPVPNFNDPLVRLIPIDVSKAGAARLVARLVRSRYAVIMTVPQWSLYWSTVAGRLSGTPVAYISDELIVDEELTTASQHKWKARERRAHRRCAFSIALSTERAELLRRINGLPESHPIYVVPNAAPGPAERVTSHYYRDVLGLPPERPIVLHAGGMGWAPAEALAAAASSWHADGPAIVFQGRLPEQMRDRRSEGAVYYSPTTLPAALLDYAVSSADVGLALYEDHKTNDRYMGTASGKLCLYMKNALPVITTRLDCFDWVEAAGCGVRIASMDELPAAVRAIRDGYDGYVCNVRRFYDTNLDFSRAFVPVAAHVDRLARS